MSLSLGGLGLVSLRNPLKDLVAIVYGKGDLRSMFCLIVFVIISFVLAYLTNPSENSFRAYLTEQSFRHHLSRLDDNADDPHAATNFHSRYATRNASSPSAHSFAMPDTPPFHFANRASIALRTPKHVFHSFAIFTIAAMVPLSKPSENDNRDCWMISDSWYIGAFGKWWRGGVLEAWYQDVISRSKDEESWSSGILSMKRLDLLQDYNGPTFSAKNLPAHLARSPPPKLRNRERPTLRHSSMQPRSTTPPPLPKSASLPLHIIRKASTNTDRTDDRSTQIQQQPHVQTCLPNDTARNGSSVPSRSSSTLFEHSPIIIEVLRQITNTKASVLDLRTQLTECESAASQSRAVLQHEVDTHRDRKRQEDASKLELKTRTKTLEDSKRGAEALKKEGEKKLKAIQLFRDNSTQRLDFLDKAMVDLQQNLSEDREFILNHRNQVSDMEREIAENLEQKRQDIKHAEDLLLVLNQRSRELEDKLASEKERLTILRDESEKLKQSRLPPLNYSPPHIQHDLWLSNSQHHRDHSPTLLTVQSRDGWNASSDAWNHSQSSLMFDELQFGQDNLSIGPAANSSPGNNSGIAIENHVSPFQANSFSPFGDLSHNPFLSGQSDGNHASMESPELMHTHRAKDIMSNGLSAPMETEKSISRSFQSDSDPYVDRDWRHPTPAYPSHYQNDSVDSRFPLATSSPTSLHGLSAHNEAERTFEARFLSPDVDNVTFGTSTTDLQSSAWVPRDSELTSFLDPQGGEYNFLANLDKGRTRRWFGGLGREKPIAKGLNPDAKEFNLFERPFNNTNGFNGHSTKHTSSYDALNPNGLGSTAATSSNSQSLLRAFAPSPAEREALQRALGGSTNTSFERLPSLSDVGSIPASPTNQHAHAHPHVHQHAANIMARDIGSILPAWLHTLPRTRKVNFSPWEDEEPLVVGAKDGAIVTTNVRKS